MMTTQSAPAAVASPQTVPSGSAAPGSATAMGKYAAAASGVLSTSYASVPVMEGTCQVAEVPAVVSKKAMAMGLSGCASAVMPPTSTSSALTTTSLAPNTAGVVADANGSSAAQTH